MRATLPIRITASDVADQRSTRRMRLKVRVVPGFWRRPPANGIGKQQSRGPGAPDRRTGTGERAAGSPATVTVGISDQHGSTFSHPLFTALGVETARFIIPWNSVSAEPEVLDAWLTAARAAGIQPLIAFEHARSDRCPDAPCRLPSVEAYAAAFQEFQARYPWVRLITPWNEPNHRSQPTASQPRRAAAFYNVARAQCGECTLVAGDVLDAPNMPAWLTEYERALAGTPRVWGLHNYYDTTYFSSSGVRTMLSLVSGEVWLTETGGIVAFSTPDGRVALPYDEARAELSVGFTLDLARRFGERIGRVYLYQWQSPADASFDAGLIAADGRPRPAYDLLRARRGSGPGGAARTAATGSRGRLLLARVRLTSHGYLSVPVACAGDRTAECAGRVTVESARYRHIRLVNGRPPAHILEPRTRTFGVPANRTKRLPFVVPRRVLRAAARGGSLRLRITLRSGQEGAPRLEEHTLKVRAPRAPRLLARGHRSWARG